MKRILFTVIILVITGLAFLAGDWYGKDKINSPKNNAEPKILYYTDPMNPGFRSEKPGTAPCGMPLEPVYGEVGVDGEQIITSGGPLQLPGEVMINQTRQQLIGMRVSPANVAPMTYSLRLYGKVEPDETRIYQLNASTDSWVRALSDMTTGSIVRKDQILAEVLAPAFYNAQVTYLIALNNIDRIREQLSGEVRHQQNEMADNQIRVAVQSLQNLGITDAQIEELANTRKAQPLMQIRSPVDGVVLSRDLTLYQWFEAGEEFFTIADIGRVWTYADVYEDEAMHLRPGMAVKVRHEQSGRTFNAKISSVLPLFDPVAKTLKVRIDVDNPQYELRPDMFVDVEIPITMPPSLHVPADSVIDSGTRQIVYVETDNSTFEPRPIETGWRLGRRVEITKGLMPGEKVIISGNFLVDSESRMKTAAGSIIQAMSRDPVCGMYVNEEYARLTGKISAYGEKTYFFCMDECRESFGKEPEKYIENIAPNKENEHHVILPKNEKSWLEMIDPDLVYQEESEGAIGRPATFPGVVDWDGPNPKKEGEKPRDWSGWGKFPGSRYLGIQDDKEKTAEQHNDTPDSDSDKKTEKQLDSKAASIPQSNAGHAGMKREMQHPPTSDQLEPPADR